MPLMFLSVSGRQAAKARVHTLFGRKDRRIVGLSLTIKEVLKEFLGIRDLITLRELVKKWSDANLDGLAIGSVFKGNWVSAL